MKSSLRGHATSSAPADVSGMSGQTYKTLRVMFLILSTLSQ